MIAHRHITNRPPRWRVLFLAGCLGLSGCGYSGGKMLYMLGVGREPLIKAQFQLTDGPILILVDDFADRVDWPAAKRHLTDALSQELIKRSAAKKIIPRRTVEHLRQTDPGLARRGCREVGELAGAEQVLWIEVRDFLADENIESLSNAAYFCVAVKIINVLEKEQRSRVRLWPSSSAGYYVPAKLPGDAVTRLKTKDAISKELAEQLAAEITNLFCDHRPNKF